MPVNIAALWTPAVWVEEMREKQATFPTIFNSGAVLKSGQFDEFATGPGISVNMPFFKDITDQTDEIQVEDTAPTVDNGQPSGLMVAPLLNRVTKNSGTALAAQVSGSDPVGNIVNQLLARRFKQRNATLIAMLRGAFGAGATAIGGGGALAAVRYDIGLEAGAAPAAAQLMSVNAFCDGKALMGELADDLEYGAILAHPNVIATLEKADAVSFKQLTATSGLPFTIRTYRGIPIFASSLLSRAGTTSGTVYETFILAPGVVAYGQKAQQGDTIDVASLSYFQDKDKNNEIIYDRTRFLMHLNGMKWVGAPAGQSALNSELQTIANWNLVYQTANRVGGVCIRSNG